MTCIANPNDGMVNLYDRLAPVYDKLHQRWLRMSGGEAQAALEAAVRVAMSPKSRLLDAGCGTGRFARCLLAEGVTPEQITLLEPSRAMLAHCADLPVEKTPGRLEAMAFHDASFDIATCAWALETVPEPYAALGELCRVLRPGGLLCLTFCAEKPSRSVLDWVMQMRLVSRGTGQFLSIPRIEAGLRQEMNCDVRVIPSSGPAATLIARRHQTGSSG